MTDETRRPASQDSASKAPSELDARLDEELADTFPASDPPSITQPMEPDVTRQPHHPAKDGPA